jgi:hypothetical protein
VKPVCPPQRRAWPDRIGAAFLEACRPAEIVPFRRRARHGDASRAQNLSSSLRSRRRPGGPGFPGYDESTGGQNGYASLLPTLPAWRSELGELHSSGVDVDGSGFFVPRLARLGGEGSLPRVQRAAPPRRADFNLVAGRPAVAALAQRYVMTTVDGWMTDCRWMDGWLL